MCYLGIGELRWKPPCVCTESSLFLLPFKAPLRFLVPAQAARSMEGQPHHPAKARALGTPCRLNLNLLRWPLCANERSTHHHGLNTPHDDGCPAPLTASKFRLSPRPANLRTRRTRPVLSHCSAHCPIQDAAHPRVLLVARLGGGGRSGFGRSEDRCHAPRRMRAENTERRHCERPLPGNPPIQWREI